MRKDGLIVDSTGGKSVAAYSTVHRPEAIHKGTSGPSVTGLRLRIPSLAKTWGKVKVSAAI